MVRLIKCFFVFFMLVLVACSSEANEEPSEHPISTKYHNLVSSYNKQVSEGDFKGAYSSAEKLLGIDPSDTTSYLRLAIAVRELNLNLSEIKGMYEDYAGEATEEEKALKLLASALLIAPN